MNRSQSQFIKYLAAIVLAGLLAACGGGGGGGDGPAPAPITSFELVDPNPRAGNRFGDNVVILANGNVVVTAPIDSGNASGNGAVHLYNPRTQARIGSIVGDTANDFLGSGGVTALANGNFVIASPFDDVGGLLDAGSVKLINGATGAQIGSTIAGDAAGDFLGSSGVTALANSNFVIASPSDDVGGMGDAGSVMLINGATGAQIGSPIAGNAAGDALGSSGVAALVNGNFVVASPNDDFGGVVDSGSVMLFNGTTRAQIGVTIAGDAAGDQLGFGGVTALANGNFVIASPLDDVGGVVNAGSVMLINGATGAQIGSTVAGNAADDTLGSGGVTALVNGNFVIASPFDDFGGVANSGSVMLFNGTTRAQIGFTIAGDTVDDFLGSHGVTALANGNFVIASPFDNVGGVVDAGSVMLFSGATGAQIGSTIAGDAVNDFLGPGGVTALANGNFVIAWSQDDVGGVVDAGSVKLINGTTGAQIGSTIAGDAGDFLGSGGVTALANSNFVIASPFDSVGGVNQAGSVMLINGATGAQIGSPIAGDAASDQLGSSGVTALANSSFVIASQLDDVGGVIDAGSVMLINGTTGAQIGSTIAGTSGGDVNGARIAGSATADFYVLGLGRADRNGLVDSGLARLIAQ